MNMQMPKSIKIFLGSSIVELSNEQQDISLLTNDISRMFKLGDIDVQFVLCENIETGNDGKWGHDDQAIIDEKLCECDVSLFLFRSKAGKLIRSE